MNSQVKKDMENLSKDIKKINANPYIWTDPFAIKDVARNKLDTLIEFDNGNSKFYKKNYNDFLSEIDEIFLKILQNLNKSNINSFYAIEDYWDYFANRFRLEIIKKDKKKEKQKTKRAPSGFAKPTKVTKELCEFMNNLLLASLVCAKSSLVYKLSLE